MIKLGQTVAFNQFHYAYGGGNPEDDVVGTVIYVNEPHRYFTAEYEKGGHMWKLSFNFDDLIGVGHYGRVRIIN